MFVSGLLYAETDRLVVVRIQVMIIATDILDKKCPVADYEGD